MNAETRVYDDVFDMLPREENPSPMVRITRLAPVEGFELFAKLEWMNPFGSVKDRAAWSMLRDLEVRGQVSATRGIVEPTSGNTGISLAAMASVRGYKARAVVPEKVPDEKKVILRIAGADVDVMTDSMCPSPGMGEGSIGMARSYARAQPDKYVMPNQYENAANERAHIETTGPEIWRQTDGRVTHVFCSLGTCGTAMGLAQYFREKHPQHKVKIIAVQPTEGHDVPGIRSKSELHVAKLLRPELVDEVLEVETEAAYAAVMELCQREGLFAGPSSGLIFEGARRVLRRDRLQGVGVMIFCDSVFKYVSSMVKHVEGLGEF
ncbi:MAG TPA: cysteine synthase family protein [Phycisphaerales bacterium]|nr:cysteine synthase family protein [Phycisphaerales bacterium]